MLKEIAWKILHWHGPDTEKILFKKFEFSFILHDKCNDSTSRLREKAYSVHELNMDNMNVSSFREHKNRLKKIDNLQNEEDDI